MSTNLTIALREEPDSISGPKILIEDSKGWNIHSPEDFGVRLRRFLDDLKHLKYLDHIRWVTPTSATDDDVRRLNAYKKKADEVVGNLKGSFGYFEDSVLGIENLFENLELLIQHPDISHIKIEKPFRAVVVAAGPSLDISLEALKKFKIIA